MSVSCSGPLFGSVIRRQFYNGAWWIHVRQEAGFWSDASAQWANVRQGFTGHIITWDRRLEHHATRGAHGG